MSNLVETINLQFPRKKIVIIGDLVADQFLHGTIARVSREAPFFILRHDETETFAGGAANAAVNIAALGAQAILVGIAGKDVNGDALLRKLYDSKVDCRAVVVSENLKTTTKVRVLAGQHYAPRQQVIRIDYENESVVSADLTIKIKENLILCAGQADAIIISDYNYGVATTEIFAAAREFAEARKIPLLIDSRFRLTKFSGATTATPNQDEVEQILGAKFSENDCVKLRKKLDLDALLVTRGNKGMLLAERNRPPLLIDIVGSKEPVDVTGAGDTVIAAYALGLACGLSFAESANLANHAGGIVVMKKGTASVTPRELIQSIENAPENRNFNLKTNA